MVVKSLIKYENGINKVREMTEGSVLKSRSISESEYIAYLFKIENPVLVKAFAGYSEQIAAIDIALLFDGYLHYVKTRYGDLIRISEDEFSRLENKLRGCWR